MTKLWFCVSDSKPKSLELTSTIEFSHLWTWYIGGISGHLHDGPILTSSPQALMMASIAAFNQRPAARRVALGLGWLETAHWMRFHHQVICWIWGLQKLPNLGAFFGSSWKKAGKMCPVVDISDLNMFYNPTDTTFFRLEVHVNFTKRRLGWMQLAWVVKKLFRSSGM